MSFYCKSTPFFPLLQTHAHTPLFHKPSSPLTSGRWLLALEEAAFAGMGPIALFLVGLPHFCPRRHWGVGVTSLLVLPPGFDVFNCSSVSGLRRRERLRALTTLFISTDAQGTSAWVTQTFPSNTPLDTFSEQGLEAPCSYATPEAEAMDTCLCVNPALETAPPRELRAQPSALRFQAPNLRGSDLND